MVLLHGDGLFVGQLKTVRREDLKVVRPEPTFSLSRPLRHFPVSPAAAALEPECAIEFYRVRE